MTTNDEIYANLDELIDLAGEDKVIDLLESAIMRIHAGEPSADLIIANVKRITRHCDDGKCGIK